MYIVSIKDKNDTAFLNYDSFYCSWIWDREQACIFQDVEEDINIDNCIDIAFEKERLNRVYQFDRNSSAVSHIVLEV
jgi:hypothetical protein